MRLMNRSRRTAALGTGCAGAIWARSAGWRTFHEPSKLSVLTSRGAEGILQARRSLIHVKNHSLGGEYYSSDATGYPEYGIYLLSPSGKNLNVAR